MTTIATDGRSMAGDSQVTAGSEFVGYRRKVFRTPDGRVFGAVGPTADAQLFAKWMMGEVEKPELSEDFAALVLTPESKVFYLCRKLEPVEYIWPQAIGSGGDLAIGAMLAGATPERAVRIACARDNCTGGEITVDRIATFDLPPLYVENGGVLARANASKTLETANG